MKTNRRFLMALVVGLFGLLTATVVRADVIYSDYGPGMTFSSTAGWCISGPSTLNCGPFNVRWVASPFTSSGNFILTQVDLALLAFTGTNGAAIELVNDQSGLPGSTVLESWTVSTLSSGNLTLTSTGGVTLQNGAQYWLVAMPGSAGDTLDFWRDEPTGLLTGTVVCAGPPNSLGNGCISNNGTSWFAVSTLTAFDVQGTAATPEPSSLVLLGTGLLCLGPVLRRRAPVLVTHERFHSVLKP